MRYPVGLWATVAMIAGSASTAWAAGPFTPEVEVQGTTPTGRYGFAVSVDQDTTVVGMPFPAASPGAAYVLVRNGSTWTPQGAGLSVGDAAAGDSFGYAVAVSGDTALVGAPGKAGNVGVVYVFARTGSVWTEQQEIIAPGGQAGALFGNAVALNGNTALVGSYGDNMYQGRAYVLTSSGGVWSVAPSSLVASDGQPNDKFGWSVAFDGSTFVVGAPFSPALVSMGAAYVFTQTGSTYTQQQKLTIAGGSSDDSFGYSVAVSGTTALVGAFGRNNYQGSAFIFTQSGSTWTERRELTASDAVDNAAFGSSVALQPGQAIVGATGAAVGGAVYAFAGSGSSWVQQEEITPSDAAPNSLFGNSVALTVNSAIPTSSSPLKWISEVVIGSQEQNGYTGASYWFVQLPVPAPALGRFAPWLGLLFAIAAWGAVSRRTSTTRG